MIANIDDTNRIRNSLLDNKERLSEKRIVIFGCTIYARQICENLQAMNLSVSAFIDNNPLKVGKKCMGLDIFSPNELLRENTELYIAVIASKYHQEMIGQLMQLGFENDQIVDIPVSESVSECDDSIEDFDSKLRDVVEGQMVYKRYCKMYPEAQVFFLCPYPGTGDIYMACGFLPEYLKKNGIGKYVLLVIGKNCCRVAELFGIQNIESITKEDSDKLLKAWEFCGNELVNIKPLLHWGWRTKRYLFSNNHQDITFAEMFKYDVMELDETVQFKPPIFEDDEEYTERLFTELGLKKNKTVILAPYASSFVSDIPTKEWENLAERLKKSGYTVCTNCYGKKEHPIEGTKAIGFPYDKAKSVLENAGTFIGIRSGLCDVISSIGCKQIILYENGFNASSIEYFGLKNMGINREALEFVYDGTDLIELLRKVLFD